MAEEVTVEKGELLASTLRLAVMRVARRLRSMKSDETLSLTQLSALASIDRYGPLSPTALAEIERVQPPSMTRVIAALEERVLVEREPHPSDRRASVIAISESGHRLITDERARGDLWLAGVLAQLSPEDRETLGKAVPLLARLSEI